MKHEQEILNTWKTNLKSLGPDLNDDGLIVVRSRLKYAVKKWGNSLPAFFQAKKEGDKKVRSTALGYKQQGLRKFYKNVTDNLIKYSDHRLVLFLHVEEQVVDSS